MAYTSTDGTFWTVNEDPKKSGNYMAVKRRKRSNAAPLAHERLMKPADAGAKAAQRAYEQGVADGLKAAQEAVASLAK